MRARPTLSSYATKPTANNTTNTVVATATLPRVLLPRRCEYLRQVSAFFSLKAPASVSVSERAVATPATVLARPQDFFATPAKRLRRSHRDSNAPNLCDQR